MWTPPINFVSLHYAYILTLGLLGLLIIGTHGNVPALDSWFFGVSASTESGLNTIDVKALKTYQQLFIYFVPIVSNLGFINIFVVLVRIYWFEKRLSQNTRKRLPVGQASGGEYDAENATTSAEVSTAVETSDRTRPADQTNSDDEGGNDADVTSPGRNSVSFKKTTSHEGREAAGTLYVPPPRERDEGKPIVEIHGNYDYEGGHDGTDSIRRISTAGPSGLKRRRPSRTDAVNAGTLEHVASSMFVLGSQPSRNGGKSPQEVPEHRAKLPYLSSQATVGRNSQFDNLTPEDRETLGGIEYRALKLLLKIITAYFFGLHIFGAICLLGWIRHCDPKYRAVLDESAQNHTWWAFYSAQTMVDNLGFTLTPDSMISFQDAVFPLLVMSFLAYAGNTLYPCALRFIIWAMHKVAPKNSSMKEALRFLLDHPRRCYTLLFPSKPTWILFGILAVLNAIDILLIILLDLKNPAVASIPPGPRFVAALFQAASARHTGTATFNLAEVNPGVQFSLLVMMYISVFPIAISIRASNTYEEKSLGLYEAEESLNESNGSSYLQKHLQNQLSFDLWYIFLGTFCIAIAEADRIMDQMDPVFAILFEVVSAYGNVGLSLGYPTVLTSLCGQFRPFSKVVICLMMIRGRHRGLPYSLDRAIMLPSEKSPEDFDQSQTLGPAPTDEKTKLKRYYTQ